MILKCSKCGKVFMPGNDDAGIPNGLGMKTEDGRMITLCRDCIMYIGRIRNDKEKMDEFWKGL